jgi:hypothetical protein
MASMIRPFGQELQIFVVGMAEQHLPRGLLVAEHRVGKRADAGAKTGNARRCAACRARLSGGLPCPVRRDSVVVIRWARLCTFSHAARDERCRDGGAHHNLALITARSDAYDSRDDQRHESDRESVAASVISIAVRQPEHRERAAVRQRDDDGVCPMPHPVRHVPRRASPGNRRRG